MRRAGEVASPSERRAFRSLPDCAQADRLAAIADELVPPVDAAKEDEAARKVDVEEAEAALKAALLAIEESNTTMGSAAAKTSDARQRVRGREYAGLQ